MKTFKSGVHVHDGKYLTENLAIEQMPIASDYYICMAQHIGSPAEPCVKVGDTVVEGQLIGKATGVISANIHSPVCGEVVGIEKRKNVRGVALDHIHIKSNDKTETGFLKPLQNATSQQIVERVREAGIVGLGGAGFPTAVKLSPSKPVDTLIINAAECEPYLNSDNRIMIERTNEFIEGTKLIAKALNLDNIIVGIEENKPQAIEKLSNIEGIKVEILKKKYPQGAEKMLIDAVCKRRVPQGGLPQDVGVVVNNVATAYAVWDAVINGVPLYKKVVTVSGQGINTPKNIELRVGSTWQTVADFCGGLKEDTVKAISGGPMMGFAMENLNSAVLKTDSAFLALTEKEVNIDMPTPCIRCGKCVDHCPMFLSPIYIDFYANSGDFALTERYGALDCIECGVCTFVCPAKRPIVQMVHLSKIKLRELKEKK